MPKKITLINLLAALILVFSGIGMGTASAAVVPTVSPWMPIGPDGGSVAILVVDPQAPNTIYAGNANGVYKTVNGGDTWTQVGLTGNWVYALAIDPISHTTIYAGTRGQGVYKSLDSGSTWLPANIGIEDQVVYTMAINPLNPNTLYVGSRSISSGKSPALDEWDPGASPASSANIDDAGTAGPPWGGGVFRSLNGGLTWTRMNSGLTEDWVYALAIDPSATNTVYAGTHSKGVFKSLDYGVTWFPANTGLFNYQIRSIVIDPLLPDIVTIATWHGGVFQSVNKGETWGNNSLNGLKVRYLAALSNVVYAGTWGAGIYKSIDEGRSFTAVNKGIWNEYVNAIAIHPSFSTTAYAGFDGFGVFKTVDGSVWSQVSKGLNGTQVTSLAIHPWMNDVLYAGTIGSGVYKTYSYPSGWAESDYGLTNLYTYSLVINRAAPSQLFAGTNAGVFKSSNDGISWSLVNQGLPQASILALAISPDLTPVLYAGTPGYGIYSSTDGGLNWKVTGMPVLQINTLLVDPHLPGVVYAGTETAGVIKSADYGATWYGINQGLASLCIKSLAADPDQSNILYVGTAQGMYQSIDAGLNWSTMNFSAIPVTAIVVDPLNTSIIYAGTSGSGVYSKTSQNWKSINTGLSNLSITTLVLVRTGSQLLSLTAAPDFEGFTFTKQDRENSISIFLPSISSLRPYDENLFAGTLGGGLNVLNISTGNGEAK